MDRTTLSGLGKAREGRPMAAKGARELRCRSRAVALGWTLCQRLYLNETHVFRFDMKFISVSRKRPLNSILCFTFRVEGDVLARPADPPGRSGNELNAEVPIYPCPAVAWACPALIEMLRARHTSPECLLDLFLRSRRKIEIPQPAVGVRWDRKHSPGTYSR